MTTALLAPAEEPGLWTPPSPGTRLVHGDGFTLVARHERASIEQVRLRERAVAAAVREARTLAAQHGARELVWWVGELSRPRDLVERLSAEGLVPYVEEPLLVSLTIDHRPPAPEGMEVRRVDDLAGYREAIVVDAEAWDMPEHALAGRLESAAASWRSHQASGRVDTFVAHVLGRPAGFGRLVATDRAGVLMGGSVVPWARGRGAYRALVRARWDASAARGVPRLVTSAGVMSRPVLEGLGFVRIGEVRLLRDPLA